MDKVVTKKCFGCKQPFRVEELIAYTPLTAKISHNYCRACLKEKQARENFSNKICEIFGVKTPGPRIWTERKRLIDKYGYTDNIIIDCLEYIYNVLKKKKVSESLYAITPNVVSDMINWKNSQMYIAEDIIKASETQYITHLVQIKENTTSNKTNWDSDEWLNID